MKSTQTSITAQGIAFVRAYESSKPADQRICDDPLARKLISPALYHLFKLFVNSAEKRGPGMYGFLVARCRYIDDILQKQLSNGIQQLVILGAGLDSRPYRFEALQKIKTYEVDSPATQAAKLAKVEAVLGEVPSHVTYVPVDFNVETLDKLFSFGFDPSLETLIIWEGVTYYLTAEAVDRTLNFAMKNTSPSSSIVFDYIYTSALTSAHKRSEVVRMQRSQRITGEGLTFSIEAGSIESFLKARGFKLIELMTSQDLHRAYFTGNNQNRTVAETYAIAHAQPHYYPGSNMNTVY
jgi:methyltransferase (TIGR00027 family)